MAELVKESKEFRKWRNELSRAEKREKDWRTNSEKLVKKARGDDKRRNAYNLLAANTEILSGAVYNSLPRPDVRRRFRDSDQIGKVVSQILERGLSYSIDVYCFDDTMRQDVWDGLLVGRGISRIRYVPSFKEVGDAPDVESVGDADGEQKQELEYEQAHTEHVAWQDFRRGFARTWEELPWVAFRHYLTRPDVEKQFGDDIAARIKYESSEEDRGAYGNTKATDEQDDSNAAEFWEIWDKENKRVFFYNDQVLDQLIFPVDNPEGDPPLAFKDFWPIPRPLQFVQDSNSLIPVPLYELYREQAEEVDRISTRINKIVNALKVRAVYDATLSELSQLVSGEDNDMIAVRDAQKWMANGGLEKAIWWMPVEQAAAVLKYLFEARDAAKQAVYEISGISDIVRGITSAQETATAQNIKANFATGRLKRLQSEVARYARDLVRLLADVIGDRFQPETLEKMSGVHLPSAQEKQMAMMAQQPIDMPSWDEVLPILRDDMQREFRIDVETDSTIAATLEADMQALRETLTGVVEVVNGLGPAVQQGAIPVDAVKEIIMAVCRRAKLGIDVEDAMDKIKAPAPQQQQQDPKAMEAQIRQQVEQQVMQDQAVKKVQDEQQIAGKSVALDKRSADLDIRQMKMDYEDKFRQLREQVMQEVEALETQAHEESEQLKAENVEAKENGIAESVEPIAGAVGASSDAIRGLHEMAMMLSEQMENIAMSVAELRSKPALKGVRKVRGPDGRVAHRVPVYEDGTEGGPIMVQ